MRSVFGVVSLLVGLAVVGILAKKQLGAVHDTMVPTVPGTPSITPVADPGVSVQQQSQQIQQQVKAAAEAALQQPRAVPDEK